MTPDPLTRVVETIASHIANEVFEAMRDGQIDSHSDWEPIWVPNAAPPHAETIAQAAIDSVPGLRELLLAAVEWGAMGDGRVGRPADGTVLDAAWHFARLNSPSPRTGGGARQLAQER